ncbi:MAG TPA: hypothetical protein VHF02_07105 [Luteimonas sp.]|nr:hypothetical protein [Luteimonas sp.]
MSEAIPINRIDDLRNAVRYVRTRHPFVIDAMVVLPEHIHAVWTLPTGDADHSLRWRLLKSWFSRRMSVCRRRRCLCLRVALGIK